MSNKPYIKKSVKIEAVAGIEPAEIRTPYIRTACHYWLITCEGSSPHVNNLCILRYSCPRHWFVDCRLASGFTFAICIKLSKNFWGVSGRQAYFLYGSPPCEGGDFSGLLMAFFTPPPLKVLIPKMDISFLRAHTHC